jgi:hypothetical protein
MRSLLAFILNVVNADIDDNRGKEGSIFYDNDRGEITIEGCLTSQKRKIICKENSFNVVGITTIVLPRCKSGNLTTTFLKFDRWKRIILKNLNKCEETKPDAYKCRCSIISEKKREKLNELLF